MSRSTTFYSKAQRDIRYTNLVLNSVMVCDLPEKYESLKKDFEGNCHDLFEMEEVEGRRDIKVQP